MSEEFDVVKYLWALLEVINSTGCSIRHLYGSPCMEELPLCPRRIQGDEDARSWVSEILPLIIHGACYREYPDLSAQGC